MGYNKGNKTKRESIVKVIEIDSYIVGDPIILNHHVEQISKLLEGVTLKEAEKNRINFPRSMIIHLKGRIEIERVEE